MNVLSEINWRSVLRIAAKDLKEASSNKAVWVPAVVVPAIFIVVLPILLVMIPNFAGSDIKEMVTKNSPFAVFSGQLPSAVSDAVRGMNEYQTWIVFSAGFMFAPMFLVLPLMFSSIIGADSFVGEKERKTLEGLLYTPTTDLELYLGRVISSVVPAMVITWGGFIVYALVVNVAAWPTMGRIWFPLAAWWPLMLWVAPAFSVMAMAVTVLISSRVSTFMEAYQATGSLVVIAIALVAGQITGVLFLSVPVVLLVGLVIWAIDVALVRVSVLRFRRGELIARI